MAGNRIKGITIEIGGDTTQLDKSLKSVDSTLRKTQTELRDVNKLLKFDPKNTELLKQKQELLNKSVDTTKKRLEELKKAQAQMDAKGVDKNSDAYKALQREIAETQQKLKNLQKQQKDFGNVAGQVLKEVGKEMQDLGKKIKDVGDDLTKNVTTPILAVGGASLAAFTQVDKGMDSIAKKTGATGDELKAFNDQAKQIATTIPTSFDKAGEAIGEVNTRFKLTGDELTDLSTLFVKFADINDTNITTSVDQAQKALASFGLDASDAGHYLDLLTKVSQNTGIKVDVLSRGLTSNAAAFTEMGLSIDEAATLMGNIEMSGADTNAVLGGLSKALKNANADGKDMNTALAELEDAIVNGTGDVDGLTMAYELFGKSGAQVYNAVKQGSLSFQDLGTSATDAGGAVESTFDATKSPMENFQTVLNELMDLGYEIANAVMPLIQKAIEVLIPLIETLVGWWESLDEDTQGFIVTAALVVAAIGPVLSILGTLVTGIGGVISVIGTVVSVIGGPLTLAIGAAIAIGIALWKNWDTVKQKASELYTSIKTKWDGIKKAITDAINGAKKAVSDGIDKIKGLFNFNFEWPKLKMPHFKAEGSLNPFDWIKNGVPKITVDWYAKAANQPYYFNKPSIIGVGDVPEVVIGADAFKKLQTGTVTNNITIVQQPGQDAQAMARVVMREITKSLIGEERSMAV